VTEQRFIVVRSYRTVFAFERRLYRFDRWQIPLRGGLPLRALLYAPAVYLTVALLGALPAVGWLLDAVPDPVRWGLAPLAAIVALVHAQLDGRPAHRALLSLARWRLSGRWRAGPRRCPPPHGVVPLFGTLTMRPDLHAADYRAGSLHGPARVLLRNPARLTPSDSRTLWLEPLAGGPLRSGRIVSIPDDGALELR
jgi:hypothetical protein